MPETARQPKPTHPPIKKGVILLFRKSRMTPFCSADHTELFKQFTDNPGFNKSLSDAIFALTYKEGA
jgi:hypothetical protein